MFSLNHSTKYIYHSIKSSGIFALVFLMSIIGQTSAQSNWPDKPITIVVPFAAGGTTDIISRAIGQKLGENLKQTVIIDNKAGAGGTVGAAFVAKAPNDGYTLFMSTIAHSIAPSLFVKLSYEFTKDLDPIGMAAITPNVLVINKSLPVNTVAELITYIKNNPGKVNYGSAGKGSTEHLSGELFRTMTGIDIIHVPYKGGAPMMTDLIGGQIQIAIETSPSAEPHIKAGEVKALAVTTLNRSNAYPGLPTLNESGVKGYNMSTWFALMAPHGTPSDIQQRLSQELSKVLKDPAILKRYQDQGVSAVDMKPAELAVFIQSETNKWAKVIKEAGIKAE
jgi:tripartite-type tricarboxylate transporter receptor subunit TctC